ncbi:hypothetical protein VTK26DRAFT_7016 [Humicola hyalothermophila]
MVRIRLKMLPLNLVALIGLIACGASASSSSSAEASPPSPSTEVELICHTDNPAECYPKVFQPTDEFQVVHPDQDLPMGLHVRLNINTGQKEAKINVPDEDNPALEGLPVDSSVVIVDRDDQDTPKKQPVKIPSEAPAYDPVGKIKKPKSADEGEGNAFYKSLTILKKGLDIDGALEMLEEISHDIYYGLKIAEDYDTVRELFCLASSPFASSSTEQTNRARLAALTLASAAQNNPSALASISDHWPQLATSTCASSAPSPLPLGLATFHLTPPPSTSSSSAPATSPAVLKARISSLRSLLRSPTIRSAFLSADGPTHLLRLLTTDPSTTSSSSSPSSSSPKGNKKEDEEDDLRPAQRSAAFLLLDNFLDPDMGATLGEWPTKAQAPDAECSAAAAGAGAGAGAGGEGGEGTVGGAEEEACWDWHLARVAERHKKDKTHWSHELRRRVAEQRRANLERLKKKKKKVEGMWEREKVEL